jgi:hypothetical protein
VETAKRLIIGGFLMLILVLLAPAAARANGVSTWTDSWCGPASTWSGLAGLNNDYPGPATVSALAVSNGVTLANMTVGQVIGNFEQGNIEGTASGLPTSLASFTVTITLAVPGGDSVSRTMTVKQPADCARVVATTAPTITAGPPPPTNSPTITPAPLPTSATNPTTTPTSSPQPVAPTNASATTVALRPTVLGSTVTAVPGAVTTLPTTGGNRSGAVSKVAWSIAFAGLCLVTIARIGRPAKT